MINGKTLSRLILVFMACAFTFLALAYKSDKIVILQQSEKFLPDLQPRQVAKLTIASNEGVLTFERNANTWQIVQKNGYPALANKIDGLLYNLVDLRVIEPKTTNKEYYKLLDVDFVTDYDSKAQLVTLQDQNEQMLARLIIGKRDGLNIFMRKSGEQQAWLVSGALDLSTDLRDWVAQPLLGLLDEDQIREVAITNVDKQVVINKTLSDQPDFDLQHVEVAERDILDKEAINSTPYQIAEIMYEDVIPAGAIQLDWDKALKVNLSTFSDKTLSLEVTRAPEGIFARVDSNSNWHYRLSSTDYALLAVENSDFVLQDFK